MKKEDDVYLKHILDAIACINDYIGSESHETFSEEKMIQDAVIRQIEIIGEATKRLSKEFRDMHAEISWKEIAGMRDKLIHDYLGVDIDAVWDTTKKDIPVLRKKIEKILSKK